MKINYFNAKHTHALIDLPTRYSIEAVVKLLKGGSSYWINQRQLIKGRFAWGVGYGAFSVSHADVGTLPIKKSIIASELMPKSTRMFVKRYGLEWRSEKNH